MQGNDVYIDPEQIKAISKALGRFRDRKPLMTKIGRIMKTDVQMNFRLSRGPDGERWKPLKLRDGKPLRDTGRLMNSIDFRASSDEAVIGTNVKYAAVQNFGATIKPKKGKYLKFKGPDGWIFAGKVTIPARPFIGLGPRQIRKINRAIEEWAQRTAK